MSVDEIWTLTCDSPGCSNSISVGDDEVRGTEASRYLRVAVRAGWRFFTDPGWQCLDCYATRLPATPLDSSMYRKAVGGDYAVETRGDTVVVRMRVESGYDVEINDFFSGVKLTITEAGE